MATMKATRFHMLDITYNFKILSLNVFVNIRVTEQKKIQDDKNKLE